MHWIIWNISEVLTASLIQLHLFARLIPGIPLFLPLCVRMMKKSIYNFSDQDKVAWINEDDGIYTDLITEHQMEAKGVMIPAFGCFWLCRKK